MKKEQKEARFLETIGALGNDALVPIDRIKHIYITYKQSWELRIYSDDGDWVECFELNEEGQKKLEKRYNMIKEIVNGK